MKLSLSFLGHDYKSLLLVLVLLSACAGCGKKKDKQHAQAQNYYKLCMVELTEHDGSHAALRNALDYVQKALQYEVKPEYQATGATILFKLGKYKQSIVRFKQALAGTKHAGLRGEILNNMACVYAQMGDKNQAEKIWEKLAQSSYYLTPEVALVNLTKLCAQDQRYEVAKGYCIQAINLAPTYIDAHFYLALLSYKTNDLSLAQKEVTTILFMEPGHQGALHVKQLLSKL